MKTKTLHTLFVLTLAATAMTACGGGGDDTADAALTAATTPETTSVEQRTSTTAPAASDTHTVVTVTGPVVAEHDGPGGTCRHTVVEELDLDLFEYSFDGTADDGTPYKIQLLDYRTGGDDGAQLIVDTTKLYVRRESQPIVLTFEPDGTKASFDVPMIGWGVAGEAHITGSITCP